MSQLHIIIIMFASIKSHIVSKNELSHKIPFISYFCIGAGASDTSPVLYCNYPSKCWPNDVRCLDFSIPVINIRWNLNILHIYLRMNIRKFWQGNLAIFQMKKCLILYSIFWHFQYIIPPMIFQELSKTVLNFSCSIRAILEGRHPIYPLLLPQRKLSKLDLLNYG